MLAVGLAGLVTATSRPGAAAPEPSEVEAATAVRTQLGSKACGGPPALAAALVRAGTALTAKERLDGTVRLQQCARKAKAWGSLAYATDALLTLDPTHANPELLIRALLKMDRRDEALAMLKRLTKLYPDRKAALTLAESLYVCEVGQYRACAKATARASQAARAEGASEDAFEAGVFSMVASIAIGDLAAFEAQWKDLTPALRRLPQATAAPFLTLPDRAARVGKDGVFIDHDAGKWLALGTYHLKAAGKIDRQPLVLVRLINHRKTPRTFRIEVQVGGVTEPMRKTVSVAPGKQVDTALTPPLPMSFEPGKLRAPRTAQLVIRVTEGSELLLEESEPIEVLPRDYLPLAERVGSDRTLDRRDTAMAWLTPTDPAIDAFLTKAKARVKGSKSFAGAKAASLAQAKALFDELKARGLSVVMDPEVFAEAAEVKRTRVPAEVLATGNAHALEATLTFATLLEAIGLRPVVVFLPGHAFVGWEPTAADKSKDKRYYLDVALIGTGTFDQARRQGDLQFKQLFVGKLLENRQALALSVAKARAAGITPPPF